MILWKCCIQYASRFGKHRSGHRTGKGQFSFQSQRKAVSQKCSNYCTIALISHASKVMFKILQARLQWYVNWKLPNVQAGFRKGRGITDQTSRSNIHWIIEKARESQKNIYCCFIDYAKAFDYVDHNKLENSSRDGNTRSPYLPPEKHTMQLKKQQLEHGTTDWLQIGKGVCQGCILLPCLFNLYAEYIMWNAGLDETKN